MKFLTVRHGETENNSAGLTQGWLDTELNEKGIRQADKVAGRLKDEKIDVIYSSDLKRASRTAEEIAKFHDCELILDERLREQNKGKYGGGPAEEITRDFKESGENIVDWIPEGGESMNMVKDRVMDFLEEIEDKHKNQTVVIVSHRGCLAVISRHFHNELDVRLDDKKWKNHSHKNTAVSEYEIVDGEWRINKFNCVGHLE